VNVADVFMQQIYSKVDRKKVQRLKQLAEMQAELKRKVGSIQYKSIQH
jgi:hypothetical protein